MKQVGKCDGCGVKTTECIIEVICPNCGEKRKARIASKYLGFYKLSKEELKAKKKK